MNKAELFGAAALVISSITFIAAGHPNLVDKKQSHSDLVKTEIHGPAPGDDKGYFQLKHVPGQDIECTENVKEIHPNYNVYSAVNGSGYCYSERKWTTKSTVLELYGFEFKLK